MGIVVGIGNCQVQTMVTCAAQAAGRDGIYLHPRQLETDPALLANTLVQADVAIANVGRWVNKTRQIANSVGRREMPVLAAPRFHFSGFHPDCVLAERPEGERRELPMGNANSAIVLAAWRDGLSADEAITLFRAEVFEALGYFATFDVAMEMLEQECSEAGFDVAPFVAKWIGNGPFVHLPLHPKLDVLKDITIHQLQTAGIEAEHVSASEMQDDLAKSVVWPVYPEIARSLGIAGDYIFRPKNTRRKIRADLAPMMLHEFVERTYECYRQSPPDLPSFGRMADPRFSNLRRFLKPVVTGNRQNPYRGLSDSHWWSKSVAEPDFHAVDPVSEARFTIGKHDRIATAGSCFAQHIARRLSDVGFSHLVTEQAPPGCADPGGENYGVFTARYGNIYTVRQMLQLVERAYCDFIPAVDSWSVDEGGFVDPFRPRIGSDPFKSLDELNHAREIHFAAVREMIESATVFVFTLGLTEAWWSKDDHAVVPLAPGVVGATCDADAYVPKNFTGAEVSLDLQRLVDVLTQRNPLIRILLTVSPVPLIASFGDEHVLSATTYSKSVLRVAAGEVAQNNAHVAYFPSFEIITGAFNRGRYFAEDLRQVTEAGVDHVMRSFLHHYTSTPVERTASNPHADSLRPEIAAAMQVVCDEEVIAVSATG